MIYISFIKICNFQHLQSQSSFHHTTQPLQKMVQILTLSKGKRRSPISHKSALLASLSSLRKLFQSVKRSPLLCFIKMTSGQKTENVILPNVLSHQILFLSPLATSIPPHSQPQYKYFNSKYFLKETAPMSYHWPFTPVPKWSAATGR